MNFRLAHYCAPLLAAISIGVAGCDSVQTTQPALTPPHAGSADVISQVYTSGSNVTAWDPIIPAAADPTWPTTTCTATPLVGPNANWQNPHNAYVLTGHPWASLYFVAPWINAYNSLGSIGPSGQSWTKYQTTVSGNGSFVIKLLADNCSWIYLDGTLVGVQPAGHNATNTQYGLTLNGTHTLSFIIFDGGGANGGKFLLATTTNPPPPLNPDLDGDGHPNDQDAFPLDPTRWSLDTTPPVITPSVVGTLGTNGWYTSNVGVTWSVVDNESAATKSGCDALTLTADQAEQSYTCTAKSDGGTASQTVKVKIDQTPPTVTYSATNGGVYTVDQTVSVTCTPSDNLSGVQSSTCANVSGDAYNFAIGTTPYSATATDFAGNTGQNTTSITVSVTRGSLCALVERWVSNQGVANSLCVKLSKGNYAPFRNEVEAQSGKKISAEHAAILLRLVNSL